MPRLGNTRLVLAATLCFAGASACSSTPHKSAPRAAAAPPEVVLTPDGAPPSTVTVEVARRQDELERGLMQREKLEPDHGMLFLFAKPDRLSFWMHDTYIPLDMIFIGADHKVVGIVEKAEPLTDSPRAVDGVSQFVLEVTGGWAAAHRIAPGTPVRFDRVDVAATNGPFDTPRAASGRAPGHDPFGGSEMTIARALPVSIARRSRSSPGAHALQVALAICAFASVAFAEPLNPPESPPVPLAEAVKGLKGKGALLARIEVETAKGTDGKPMKGVFNCTLFEDKAPLTVANFVALARGLRPWQDPSGKWVKKPLYDGTSFHRVIPEFMIQGGDPQGTGRGGPGYIFDDEIVKDLSFDRPALLAMANRGIDRLSGHGTNGSQFFITEKAAPWLNARHSIFGQCDNVELEMKLARLPAAGGLGKPLETLLIKKVTISRGTPRK